MCLVVFVTKFVIAGQRQLSRKRWWKEIDNGLCSICVDRCILFRYWLSPPAIISLLLLFSTFTSRDFFFLFLLYHYFHLPFTELRLASFYFTRIEKIAFSSLLYLFFFLFWFSLSFFCVCMYVCMCVYCCCCCYFNPIWFCPYVWLSFSVCFNQF